MSEIISSLAFLEDRLVWIQGSVLPDQIAIDQFVETELPFQLDRENILRATSTIQLANQLSYIAKANNLDTQAVRVSIPARFGIVKRVWVDAIIPQSQWKAMAQNQLAAEVTAPLDEYAFYLSNEHRSVNDHIELVAVLFRRDLQAFFKKIGTESQIHFQALSLHPFGVEELFRQIYGNLLGVSHLVNVTALGIESTLLSNNDFLQTIFYPYPEGEDLKDQFLKAFEMCHSDLVKRREISGGTLGEITGLFLYGYHLQPEWQEMVAELTRAPVQIFAIEENAPLQVNPGNTDFPVEKLYQYVEALGNFLI